MCLNVRSFRELLPYTMCGPIPSALWFGLIETWASVPYDVYVTMVEYHSPLNTRWNLI